MYHGMPIPKIILSHNCFHSHNLMVIFHEALNQKSCQSTYHGYVGLMVKITFNLDAFSPPTKLASIHQFVSMIAIHNQPLHQVDNVFLHGDLHEEVYLEPLGFVAQAKYGEVCSQIAIWFETESPNLFWEVQQCNSSIWQACRK